MCPSAQQQSINPKSPEADLLKAVFDQDVVEVKAALDAGANVNVMAEGNRSPLWGAVAYGNLELTKV